MKILADTSVWSLALRRKEPDEIALKLADVIRSSLIVMIGPVRQEVLSGISAENVFNALKSKLEAFNDHPITTRDYETAAHFCNTCRSHGIQGSHTDFLICSVAYHHDFFILTTDKDFNHYAKYLPIKLYV
jgi:hypothetical protein